MVKYWARKGGLSTPVVSALPASDARLAQTPRAQAAADRLPARLCGMAPSADRHASPLIRRLAPGKGFPERKAALTAARSNTPSQCPRWVKRVGFVMSAICPVYPKQQTSPGPVGTSRSCHKQTLAAYSIASSALASSVFVISGVPGSTSKLGASCLWCERIGPITACRRPSRQGAARRQAGRAADRVRAGDQPQSRKSAWPPHFAIAALGHRRGDRVKRSGTSAEMLEFESLPGRLALWSASALL
jgi:hypothetical protein